MKALVLPCLLLLASGCVLRHGHPGAPPHRAHPRAMTHSEAVGLALAHCQARGYACELREAHLTGNNVWKVKLHAGAGNARGHLHLAYDAVSRELLTAKERVKVKGGPDRDDDDEGEKRKGKGHGKKG